MEHSNFTADSEGRFNMLHHEKLPSAQERYGKELHRIVGVLNAYLKDKDWLVGDKCTYTDLSFIMWNVSIDIVMKDCPVKWNIEDYPDFKRWMEALKARPAVSKALNMWQQKEVKSAGSR